MTTTLDCAGARNELMRGIDRVSGTTARHLDACDTCRDFAARFSAARESLRGHGARMVPDAGFAARVAAALPAGEAAGDMTWAALRLLPAALTLALVLGAWCWIGTSWPADLDVSAPSEDVLAWVLENGS